MLFVPKLESESESVSVSEAESVSASGCSTGSHNGLLRQGEGGGDRISTCNRSCSSCGGFKIFIFLECSLNKHATLVCACRGYISLKQKFSMHLWRILWICKVLYSTSETIWKSNSPCLSVCMSLRLSNSMQAELSKSLSLSSLDETRHACFLLLHVVYKYKSQRVEP